MERSFYVVTKLVCRMRNCLYCSKVKNETKLAFCQKCSYNIPQDEQTRRITKYKESIKSIKDYFDDIN